VSETLAKFTPSLVSPEVLEKLFVGREGILSDLVQRAIDAQSGTTRAHRMVIGPRGAGKTHLMSLAHHRIAGLKPAPLIAWLAEDPWDIDGYEDFLRAVLTSVSTDTNHASVTELRRMPAQELETRIKHLASAEGPIVVIAENFDQILATIEIDGQRRLRGLLENHRAMLLLVTATRLVSAVAEQDQPFYGFFSSVELEPFTIDQAIVMLQRIAEHRGETALAARLASPPLTDRYRLQAIDALAGGQPRIWAVFGIALTIDGLDHLTDLLLTKFDDLTPYYQEQLGRLSAQERKAVRALADLDRALSVRDLSEELGVDQKSIAKTLTTLKRCGWIQGVTAPFPGGDKRKSHYELAEPLARLSFQLKDTRGKPLPLVVAFLSLWFSQDELRGSATQELGGSYSYLTAALSSDGTSIHALASGFGGSAGSTIPEPLLLELCDALERAFAGDPNPFFSLPTTIRRLVDFSIEDQGLEATWRSTIAMSSRSHSWIPRAEALLNAGTVDVLNRSILATVLGNCGRFVEALALDTKSLQRVIEVFGPDHPDTLKIRHNIAFWTGQCGNPELAITQLEHVLHGYVQILGNDHPDTLTTRGNLALWLGTYGDTGRAQQELKLLLPDQVRVFGPDHPDTLNTRSNLAFLAGRLGKPEEAKSQFQELLIDQERALGVDHPDVLTTRLNNAFWADAAGDQLGARYLYLRLLVDQERILGRDHPQTLTTRNNLAYLAINVGDREAALEQFQTLLQSYGRVLGPHHPDTLTTLSAIERLTAGRLPA
jgi:tetratricopeptide (TPR) repeat protein